MNQAEKYRQVMILMAADGFIKKVSISSLRNEIMKIFPIKEGYIFKFHVKNMESLGLIKQSDIVGIFDIVEREE